MKNRDTRNFWIGFVTTAAAVMWLVWLWRQRREVSPPPVVLGRRPTATPARSMPTRSDERSDPLEKIKGIGPVYARRLREVGITTFARLAEQPPELLRQITGAAGYDPADWIAEAIRLESGHEAD